MKKPLMTKKTAIILVVSVLVIMSGLLIFKIINDKGFTSDHITMLIPIGLSVSALAKLLGTNKKINIRDSAAYETTYKKEIRYAFGEKGREKHKQTLLNGIMYYAQDNYDMARRMLLSLIPFCETRDDFRATYLFLALNYTDAGLTDSAIEAYRECLAADPEYSTAWSNLGLQLSKKGNIEDAFECYFNSLRYDENNAYAHNNIAQACVKLGYYYQAIDHALKAYELNEGVYQATSALAIAYSAIGEPEKAEKYFKIYAVRISDASGLRNMMQAVAEGNSLIPDGVEITSELKNAMNSYSRETSVPCSQLALYDEESHTKSRFGGGPIGEAPLDDNGSPMALLCALYLSEFKFIPNLPSKGLLLFYAKDDEFYGATKNRYTTLQSTFKVVYTENEDAVERATEYSVSKIFPVQEPHIITPVSSMWNLTNRDFRFKSKINHYLNANGLPDIDDMNQATKRFICDNYCGDGHKVGGYPLFAEKDIREDNTELQKYDSLLLQIDTHDGKIQIGENGGSIKFFISAKSLIDKDFSDILYTWDD